ncbi:hypothetical protein PtrM4_042230 [Pyrenophora tritici-repentis]|uniref:Alpha/beta hydrolase n=1 Tax=Pyrenophora tritici-repentis TaxID=45151 RepID=A0A834VIX3_9PLEO|nr:hypothetical protein PtrM4_042230 [Pyrenophora tritici-repentis]
MSVEEGEFALPDGKQLYTKTFRTDGPAKARLVFIHGFSDHGETITAPLARSKISNTPK